MIPENKLQILERLIKEGVLTLAEAFELCEEQSINYPPLFPSQPFIIEPYINPYTTFSKDLNTNYTNK